MRNDKSKENELSHTANRSTTINQIQIGDVNETNLGVYASANFNFGKFVINPALRLDYFNFEYNDELQPNYRTQSETGSVISPKLKKMDMEF